MSEKKLSKAKRPEKIRFSKNKRIVITAIAAISICTVVICTVMFIFTQYKVTSVFVSGNIHYTDDEIIAMVMDGRFGDNSLFLSMKYKNKGIENVPFVETMDVDILSKDSIKITVYEKSIAGCVTYLGRYVYFDKDGIVVETSISPTPGIPQVTGLRFDSVVLHEALPVENQDVFQYILTITQQLDKYELAVDKIYFDKDYKVTLVIGGVKVRMGDYDNLDEKIMQLQYILPELAGKEGELDMSVYSEDTTTISFTEAGSALPGSNVVHEDNGEDTETDNGVDGEENTSQ